MVLGFVTLTSLLYTIDDKGNVYLNLTKIDPLTEASRLRDIATRPQNAKHHTELTVCYLMLEWAADCPLRKPMVQDSELVSVRFQGMEHVINNTPTTELPYIIENIDRPHLDEWATRMNLTWVQQRYFLFGGYYRDANGNCYYPDVATPAE